jgi:large conductance mechanosensitive channel
MKLIKEFREFAVKGNIVDLAVAVMIGAAFGKIISSMVDNILMPIVGIFINNRFDNLTKTVNGVPIKYGLFLQATVDFIIVAFILFLIVKGKNRINRKTEIAKEVKPSLTDTLLMEIRDELKQKNEMN